jgi:hypothetical protein
MQQAVFKVIIKASIIDKKLVCKKAGDSKHSHRTTEMCDQILFEVEGFQVLDDDDV